MITSIYDGETKARKHQILADYYDFHHQAAITFDNPLQLTGGDSLIVECFYDERDRDPQATGVFGIGTFDEM